MTNITPISSHKSVLDALYNIRPGQKIVYFTGQLDKERLSMPKGPADIVANIAYLLCSEGKLHLFQKRLGPPKINNRTIDWSIGVGPGFDYIAIGAAEKKMTAQVYNNYRPKKERV